MKKKSEWYYKRVTRREVFNGDAFVLHEDHVIIHISLQESSFEEWYLSRNNLHL